MESRHHPKLRRVSRGAPIRVEPPPRLCSASDDSQPAQHIPADRTTSTPTVAFDLSNLNSHSVNKFPRQHSTATSTNSSSAGSSVSKGRMDDSCYSSGSEESQSHASLSRESSDALSSDLSMSRLKIDDYYGSEAVTPVAVCPYDLLDFAISCGYTEQQLLTVLQKIGFDAGQDRVLAELVQLRKSMERTAAVRMNSSSRGAPAPGLTARRTDSAPIIRTNTSSPNGVQEQKSALRPIVIDGSNIAMTHGRKEIFSCAGIKDCVRFFVERGHKDILVFIPQFRREIARADCPITDQHVLNDLDNEGKIVWTPSRRINGRRIVCHDDRYILKTAEEKDAVIVSNDEYRDLVRENPSYRKLVENRLLMYSFVDGKFMPPDDPLGRHGPKLDQFLGAQTGISPNIQPCPYAKKCTYGNKCKYYHPERLNGIHVSVTERLMKEKSLKKSLSATTRPSMQFEAMKNAAIMSQPPPINGIPLNCLPNHNSVGRTQSLNAQLESHLVQQTNQENHLPHPMAPPHHLQLVNCVTSVPPPSWPYPAQQQMHNRLNVGRNQSFPLSPNSGTGNPMPRPTLPITSVPPPTASSAFGETTREGQMYTPSTAVWGESELSVGPLSTANRSMADNSEASRARLQYHLCQLFPEPVVVAIMEAHPNETNSQVLCERILAMRRGFQNTP
ncbi:hypothetical protein WR25_19112 [Diploscapter pachys]|uniref:C3H1-type domain-containing protein n=1 Tax=Diploscapter pachys TaxID=2018661 RepID=A0A2A2L352_9BILA|nr:hypothetical protein WR25_19112 [Diploscapter pachys]